jgi:hypothetical protein
MPAQPLHLLVPFALIPAADAQVVLSKLDYPALGALLARASLVERATGEDFQRTLPHERWLATRFGALGATDAPAQGSAGADDAPLAPYMMLADGADPGTSRWAVVEPAHIQIAHDHLVLIEPDSLGLSDDECAALLEAARPSFDAIGVRVQAPTVRRWYVSGDALGELVAAPPLRAVGRSIEIWLPHDARTGDRSRAWMKLQNEVQMSWFEHPVNRARESQGHAPVNGLWLYAQGTRAGRLTSPFATVLSRSLATTGLALASGARTGAPPDTYAGLATSVEQATVTSASSSMSSTSSASSPSPTSSATLVELDALATPYVQQDWYTWHETLARYERDWFAPALAALRDGSLRELTVTLTGDTGAASFALTRNALRLFWRRRPLASAITE